MGRQTRPSSGKISGVEGDLNVILMGKKTKQFLAKKAGDPELANLSRRARALIRSAEEHYNPLAIEEVLKENLIRNAFAEQKKGIWGYTLETIPLDKRGMLKDKLWDYHTNYGEGGKWSPYLLELKLAFDREFWKKTWQYTYDRSLEDFERHAGLLSDVAIYDVPDERIEANIQNIEFVRLIELHDSDPITPVISGKQGAGKSNFVLHTFRQSSMYNRGYINPTYGKRSRLRAYLPNFDGAADRGPKQGVFPGIYSSFSYRFPWQLFIDRPVGSSILWTKYDWSMAQEEDMDDSADIYAMVYLGEIGLGKMKYPNSKEVVLYRNLFQLTRQMRIRYYISSADPEPMPVSVMEDFINPQIWIDIMPHGGRQAKAEYLSTAGRDMPALETKKLGNVPLDPLTKVMGRGIASDLTASWENFPFQKMMEYSRATNMNIYLKDIDSVTEKATHFSLEYQDNYMDEVYPEEIETAAPKPTAEHKEREYQEEEMEDDGQVDF